MIINTNCTGSSAASGKISSILVLGGGTAGFLSALTLKRKLPALKISVLQSSKLGIIGVGEGSLRQLPNFLHEYLGIDPKRFFAEVGPTWKLGIRFLWGERGDFNYTFAPQVDVVHSHPDLPRPIGYYCFEEMEHHCVASELMRNDMICLSNQHGHTTLGENVGYHLDNRRFAAFLEKYTLEQGIEIIDDLVTDVTVNEQGVGVLNLESGNILESDLYVDCSGFGSVLLGKKMQQPFISYRSSLFCDRAIIGGWDRTDEPLHPYTTSETMDSGWCWQIEHEHRINRGYVFSSDFISDDEAEQEFRRKNPRIGNTALVKFHSGRYENAWVKNVVAIGNSAGFVEPLEATAIAAICSCARALAETLADAEGHINKSHRDEFNHYNAASWDSIADFLAIHYKFNTLVNTEFWRECQASVDLRGAQRIVDFYQYNGPSQLWRLTLEDPACRFRLDGYYTLLLGQKVPHAKMHSPTARERNAWKKLQQATMQYSTQGLTVTQALDLVRSPQWQWQPHHYAA